MRTHSVIAYIQMLVQKSIFWFCKLKNVLVERQNIENLNSDANTNSSIQITQNLDSSIVIGSMSLDPKLEEGHFLVYGCPGSGKTQVIAKMLDSLRRRGDKVVLFGYSSEYIQYYFREGVDKLLNPFDMRSENWDLWREAKTKREFDDIAASLFSMDEQESPLVVNAARIIFSHMAYAMKKDPNRSLKNLLTKLLYLRAKDLDTYLPNRKSDLFRPERIGTYTFFLRSIFERYLGKLAALRPPESARPIFSVREWVNNAQDNSWLFLPFGEYHWEDLKHFSAMYFSIATVALLNQPKTKKHNIWFVGDGLHNINSVSQLPAKVRSSSQHGGRFIFSIGTYNELKARYDTVGSLELINLLATKLILSLPDFDDDNPLSISPGTRVFPGNSLKNNLGKIHCYFNFPNQVFLSELALTPEERTKVAEPFIANSSEPDPEVQAICYRHHLYGMKASSLGV